MISQRLSIVFFIIAHAYTTHATDLSKSLDRTITSTEIALEGHARTLERQLHLPIQTPALVTASAINSCAQATVLYVISRFIKRHAVVQQAAAASGSANACYQTLDVIIEKHKGQRKFARTVQELEALEQKTHKLLTTISAVPAVRDQEETLQQLVRSIHALKSDALLRGHAPQTVSERTMKIALFCGSACGYALFQIGRVLLNKITHP